MPKKKRKLPKRIRITFRNIALEKTYKDMEDDDPLKKKIGNAIKKIRNNPHKAGLPIPKKRIPKKYLEEDYKTAYYLKLSDALRLVYSLGGNEIEIVAVILDWWTSHKEYERVFGYS